MTWLDLHVFKIGSVFEERFGSQADGVRTAFTRVVETFLVDFANDVGPEAGQRFEIDLLPYLQAELATLACCFRIRPSLVEGLRTTDPDALVGPQLAEHFSKIGFSYIDFAPLAFPIGASFEVRGMFVRSATMQKRGNLVAPAFSPKYRCLDAIIGRPGIPTRQRLSWRIPGANVVVQARIPADPEYPSETSQPIEMLKKSGVSVEAVIHDLTRIAAGALLLAQRQQDRSRKQAVPRIPFGDPALHGRNPDPLRSILQVTELPAAEDSAAAS